MKALIRILCVGLCLALSMPAVQANAQDAKKNPEQTKTKSKKDSKAKSGSSAKKKTSGKDKKPSAEKNTSSKKKSAPKLSDGGFRGLAWGSPLSALIEPDLREESGGLQYYTVAGDDPEVLGVRMREVVYVYCKGKLAGALTRYDGAVNHMALLGKLADAHGTPLSSQPNLQGDRSWRFDGAGDTTVMMEYSEKASTGALAWMARDRVGICQPEEQDKKD
ncbi:MAG: hypothetical protein ACOZEN_04770 [Thermodesulfobacteriota bacterium]